MAKHLPSIIRLPRPGPALFKSGGGPRRERPRRDKRGETPVATWLRSLRRVVAHALTAPHWGRVALLFGTIIFLSALLSLHLLPDKVSLNVGELSLQTVRAARTVSYPDPAATQALRAAAALRVETVYTPVRYAAPEAEQTVGEIFDHFRQARLLGNHSPVRAAAALRQQVGVVVSPPAVLGPLLDPATSNTHLDQAQRAARKVVGDVMAQEIREDHPSDLKLARAETTRRLSAALLPSALIPATAALTRAVVRVNRIPDRVRTQAARDAEERLVAPQFGRLFAGDLVVRRGEIASPTTLAKLRALGLQNPRLDPGMIACVFLLTTLMLAIVVISLARYYPQVYRSTKTLFMLSVIAILSVLGMKIGSSLLGVRLSETQFGYIGMLCIAAAAMLIAALVNARVAMLMTALLAAQAGLILGGDLRYSVIALLSGIVGVYAVSDLRSRNDVVRAGLLLCATDVFLSIVVGRIEGDAWADLSQSLLYALLSGFFATALFWLSAPMFERLFGITTHLGLLELSDPNRPLLQKFCQAAPGTYTHSILVGNLAVTAAEAIGADALLCRVGAMYHDLGKMLKPNYFVENQGGGENVHNRLNPSLSALVVTAHVKDGLEIADREKLPPIIKAFITEHHGTSLIRYFYHQQTVGDSSEAGPGLEQHFRYSGPKPQSRETAILMLADGVEAASRTLERPTPGRIGDLVDKIIQTQLQDGQLDDCELTLRDLARVRDSFIRLLSGMLHSRIEYPDALKSDTLKSDAYGTADQTSNPVIRLLPAPGSDHARSGSPAAAGERKPECGDQSVAL